MFKPGDLVECFDDKDLPPGAKIEAGKCYLVVDGGSSLVSLSESRYPETGALVGYASGRFHLFDEVHK